MGSIEKLNKWSQMEIQDVRFQQNNFYYFTRKMEVGASCIKSYFSHVFMKKYQTQEELEKDWKEVTYYIALRYQSKLEEVIEKSNFYLCLFVSEKIDIKVRNVIENDSFCAKKYVFGENTGSLEENLQEIENKIFCINSLVLPKSSPKLESMVLQNFRGYAGNFTIDFRDSRKKAASFIVIYAKNGVGKTSLFDGVEFALKGEIGRIIDLVRKDKKYKNKGAIYHNRDNADKLAFVSLRLDRGNPREIERRVSNVVEGENDIRANLAKKGMEITGTKDDSEKWNQVILPHDKIDGFISARSATERYKEWVGSAAPLKEEREVFEKAHKIYRDEQKQGKSLHDRYIDIRDKLEELFRNRTSVTALFELIDTYNTLIEKNFRLLFQKQAGVKEYDKLLNQVKKYSRMWDAEISRLEDNIALAKEVLDHGLDEYRLIINSMDELNKSIKDLKICIQRKRELDVLIQADNENKTAIIKCEKELGFLKSIESYGVERVKEKYKEYGDIEKKIEELEGSLKSFETELKKAIEENKNEELKKGKILRLEKDEYEAAVENVKKSEGNNKRRKEIQAEYDVAEKINQQCQQSIHKIYHILDEITKFRIPKDIMELKLKEIQNIGYILDDEMRSQLFEFEENYRVVSTQIQLCQKEIYEQEKRAEELEAICQKGREYLSINRNVNTCPLCQTAFDSWETLILRVNHVQTEGDNTLKKRMEKFHSELKNLSDMYEDFYKKCEDIKEEKISEQMMKIGGLEEEKQRCMEIKERAENEKISLRNQQNQLELWFEKKNIRLNEVSYLGLKIWEKKQEEQILQSEENCKKTMDAKETAQRLVDSTRLVLNEFKEKKNQIVEDSETYRYVEFWMKQPDDFNFYTLLHKKEGALKHYADEQRKLQEKRAAYKDVENLDLIVSIERKNQQLDEIEKSKKIREKYCIFEDFSEKGVSKCFSDWTQQKERFEKCNEVLKQISEENGARYYFENYKTCIQELAENVEKRFIQVDKEEQVRNKFEEKKKVLESGLKEYFDQSVMDEIFKKIDPHDFMKDVEYELSFNDKEEPQLCIYVREDKDGDASSYRPEWYFSTAQLNTVAFSSFFSRALLAKDLGFSTIFIDDPIGHFDDMNVLGFADLIRSILELSDCQIVMSTHDEKVFRILERKLNNEYYSSCFIRLPESRAVIWKEVD